MTDKVTPKTHFVGVSLHCFYRVLPKRNHLCDLAFLMKHHLKEMPSDGQDPLDRIGKDEREGLDGVTGYRRTGYSSSNVPLLDK